MNFNAIIGKQLVYGAKGNGTVLAEGDTMDVVASNPSTTGLAIGAIVVMQQGHGTSEELRVVTNSGSLNTYPTDIFVIGRYADPAYPNGVLVKSPPIDLNSFTYARIKAGSATAKKLVFGDDGSTGGSLNLPALEVGQVYELVALDIDNIEGQRGNANDRIIEVVNENDANQLAVMQRLVDHFNRDIKYATATLHTSGSTPIGITFQGNSAGHNWSVKGTKTLGYTDSEIVTPVGIGAGTTEQMLKCEAFALAQDGQNNTYSASERAVWTEASQVIPGILYQQHILRWSDQREGEVSDKATYNQMFKVCAPNDGDNPNTTLEAIFSSLR